MANRDRTKKNIVTWVRLKYVFARNLTSSKHISNFIVYMVDVIKVLRQKFQLRLVC